MKNATVTIDYESFQSIKENADKYDKLVRENKQNVDKEAEFIELLCSCLENANAQKTADNKQYFIAQGIRAICERFDIDLMTEYGEVDQGKAPEEQRQ